MTLTNRTETIRSLNMLEILNAVSHRMFKTSERRCRVNLEAVIYNLPQDKYDLLVVGASIAKGRRISSPWTTTSLLLPSEATRTSPQITMKWMKLISVTCFECFYGPRCPSCSHYYYSYVNYFLALPQILLCPNCSSVKQGCSRQSRHIFPREIRYSVPKYS